jgi:formate/nitrite transporter FocA (FNT family)
VSDGTGDVEEANARPFDRLVEEGEERLTRSWHALVVTGLFGGLEVGVGVLGYLAVLHQTHDHLLAGVAFGLGFVVLLLANSELFTENFLIPITAVAAKRGTVRSLLVLWVVTLVTNLVGGWILMWILVAAFPEWHATIAEAGRTYVDAGPTLKALALAVLAGSTITLMTRMQHGTESDGVKVFAAMAGGFLLAGVGLFHSILDSLLVFGAIDVGSATYGEWIAWFWPTAIANIVGGVGLVTALRLVRTKELVKERRRERDSS